MTVTTRLRAGSIAGTFDEDGRRYRVVLTYREQPAQALDNPTGRTVTHEPVPPDGVEVAMSGSVYYARQDGQRDEDYTDTVSGGQCIGDAGKVPGWGRVVELWERWHLNGMRAACVHQADGAAAIYRARPGYDARDVRWHELRALQCPEGYEYGGAWLYEPVPADVLTELRAIFGMGQEERNGKE